MLTYHVKMTSRLSSHAKAAIDPAETKSFQMAALVWSGEVYESIHKAVQYKNSGAIQITTNMSESDGMTRGLKGRPLMFIQCRKK